MLRSSLRIVHQDNGIAERKLFQTHAGPRITKDFRLLDLGTGTGRVAARFIEYGIPASSIVGVDINETLFADPHFPAGVDKRVGNVSQLDALLGRKEKFDLVVANMLFHLTTYGEYVRCLEAVNRRLRDDDASHGNGAILIIVPHPLMRALRAAATIGQYERRDWAVERAPWGEEILLHHKTLHQYELGMYEAGLDVSFFFTHWAGAQEIDNNRYTSDTSIWLTLREGTKREDLPYKNLRLWMFGS